MIYRVEFEGGALVQLNGLPSAAFDALAQRVVALVQGTVGRRSDVAGE
jgi:hypothetical protein